MTESRRTRIVPEVDFDKDGKQCGYLRLFHSTHASAYGFIPIPIVVIRNGAGPTALFMSGNHGDEYEGQVALCNLVKWLSPEHISGSDRAMGSELGGAGTVTPVALRIAGRALRELLVQLDILPSPSVSSSSGRRGCSRSPTLSGTGSSIASSGNHC